MLFDNLKNVFSNKVKESAKKFYNILSIKLIYIAYRRHRVLQEKHCSENGRLLKISFGRSGTLKMSGSLRPGIPRQCVDQMKEDIR